MKLLFLILALMILSACNKSSDAATPSCTLVPKAPMQLTQSTAPDLTDIHLDQKSLIQLMSYTQQDSTCYVQLQEHVTLEKIKRAQNSPNNEFSLLSPASTGRQAYWNKKEMGGTTLMGLTIFSFVETESSEQLKQTAIVVTDTVRPWHLWHEFSHYLIGKMRMTELRKRFTAPSEKKLDATKNVLATTAQQLQANPNSEAVAQLLANQTRFYINLTERYMEFNFAHEVVIEVTLSDLVRQLKSDKRVSSQDLRESSYMTKVYLDRYIQHWQKTKQELSMILQVHTQNPVIRNMWQEMTQPLDAQQASLERLTRRQHSLNARGWQ